MKIIISETQFKLVNEQESSQNVKAENGNIRINNKFLYELYINFGGWKRAVIKKIIPITDSDGNLTYKIEGQIGNGMLSISKTLELKYDKLLNIINNLGKPEINIGGTVEKKLKKI
jgi:hypothetical protein